MANILSSWQVSLSLAAVCLLLLLLVSQDPIEGRRSVQKYEPNFVSFGLRTMKHNLDSPFEGRANFLAREKPVGLRGAISSGSFLLGDEGEVDVEDISKRSVPAAGSSTKRVNYLISPISNQIVQLEDSSLGLESLSEKYNTVWQLDRSNENILANSLECRTLRTGVELSKDDLDKATGQLVRSCKGTVALNRCEGSCSSSVLPSIKSRNGFKKECRCCNESSFRRIQVRLRECYSAQDNRRIVGAGPNLDDEPNSYMDIEVEEPIECRCRNCEAFL